jgi:hypothetical protein
MSASADLDSEDEDFSLESLMVNLERQTQRPLSVHSMAGAACCCGSDQCDSLRRSQSMLQELEAQMKIAGSLGQVSSFTKSVCLAFVSPYLRTCAVE